MLYNLHIKLKVNYFLFFYFQLSISFNDSVIKVFEYTAEKSALEDYLVEHPEEKEEVLQQEAMEAGKKSMETSDEPEISPSEPVTGSLKSTPLIANPIGG